MKGLMSTLLVCFVAAATVAAQDCFIGERLIERVEEKLITGTWYYLLVKPRELSLENRCWHDVYTPEPDGTTTIACISTLPDTNETFTLWGRGDLVDGQYLNSTYPDGPGYSTPYYMLDHDDENGYMIMSACLPELGGKVAMFAGFRSLEPSNETWDAAVNAIERTGHKIADFDKNCP